MFVAWRLRGFAKVVCFWGGLRVGWVVVDLGLLVLLLFTGGWFAVGGWVVYFLVDLLGCG